MFEIADLYRNGKDNNAFKLKLNRYLLFMWQLPVLINNFSTTLYVHSCINVWNAIRDGQGFR